MCGDAHRGGLQGSRVNGHVESNATMLSGRSWSNPSRVLGPRRRLGRNRLKAGRA
ncbi:hypothetical protein I551_5194 [Mycobacterium ulcerans str. Harvey]|uniref:Uncharacterized protein n=1 Tax=Mycobacterium ulcerans str. Harvey TaxID=1299332 RepID=A0ABN0QUH6_MYCUL|nr:hypothetical protein I551_5194 [Mycobacterium ulcerans str. Harvey]